MAHELEFLEKHNCRTAATDWLGEQLALRVFSQYCSMIIDWLIRGRIHRIEKKNMDHVHFQSQYFPFSIAIHSGEIFFPSKCVNFFLVNLLLEKESDIWSSTDKSQFEYTKWRLCHWQQLLQLCNCCQILFLNSMKRKLSARLQTASKKEEHKVCPL